VQSKNLRKDEILTEKYMEISPLPNNFFVKCRNLSFYSIISIFWGRKFPKFESRAFSCSTQTSEISPGFLKGYIL
jgi:hypothetical protein